MKLTNNYGIPEIIIRSMQKPWYGGTKNVDKKYSATEILNSTRQVVLTRRHYNELEEDATERLYALLGSATHLVLERANDSDAENLVYSSMKQYFNKIRMGQITEAPTSEEVFQALFGEFDWNELFEKIKNDRYISEWRLFHELDNGVTLSGQMDIYDKEIGSIEDWKTTSVWNWIFRGNSDTVKNWEKQLNILRYLMHKNGIDVYKLSVNAIFRDHQKSKMAYDANYPRSIEVMPLTPQELSITEAMIYDKVNELESCKDVPEHSLPMCTPEERWESQPDYKAMKGNNKRSSKNDRSYAKIKKWIEDTAKSAAHKTIHKYPNKDFDVEYEKELAEYRIEKSGGEPRKCIGYCPANKFCSFYKAYAKENNIEV